MRYLKFIIIFCITLAVLFSVNQNHANATTSCTGLIKNAPCSLKGGLQEVPDGDTVNCPNGFNFEGCSNKPQTGSGNVLCCYDPKMASTGNECTPEKVEPNHFYLCMTTEACTNVSGKQVTENTSLSKCTGSGAQNEICCQTSARTGTAVTEPTAPATPKAYKLTNPLGTADLRVIAGKVINTFLGIVGALALLVFVYAGLSYLIAGGNDQMVTKAKSTMKYGVIGVFLIMFSYAITDSFITLWTKDIQLSQSTDPVLPAEEITEAEQAVTDILSQQQVAEAEADKAKAEAGAETSKVTDPETAAKASAKSSKSNVCGTTPATEDHTCKLIKTAEKNDYNCLSGYCHSNSASNYLCCKKKE